MASPRLHVAVPAAVADINPASGIGTLWRHVLEGLAATVDLRMVDPSRRRSLLGRRPDVWLSDCGLGPINVSGPLVVQVPEAGWDDPEIRAQITPQFLEIVLEGQVGGAVKAASRVITLSQSARQQIIDHWALPPDRVHAVPLGVDGDLFRPDRPGGRAVVERGGGRADRPYVLFVSQLHPRKNLRVLRDAMSELAHRFPHQLVIVGGPAQDRPDSRALMEEATADLGEAGSKVIHFATLAENDLADLMSGADAFCLPSLMEGFGLTALEAMSCGVPVVTSDRGSLPEVVGDAGVVVPPTVEAVRDALAGILGDGTRAAALGQAARARALSFSWNHTVEGWLEVLRMAAAEGRSGRPLRQIG